MRLAAVFVGVMIGCVSAAAQSTPVRMGLWDVTIRTKATVPAAMTAAMRKNGLTGGPTLPLQTIDPPVTLRVHTCMDEAKWRKNYEGLKTARAPHGCVFSHWSEDAHNMSSGLACSAGGMSVATETKLSWTRERIHLTIDSSLIYPGVVGEGKGSYEITSLFLSSDCGSVAQGASVPAK